MPRFFFHLYERGVLILDEEGRDFPDLKAAVEQAKVEVRDVLAAEVIRGRLCLGDQIELEEETTGRVFIVPFSAAVQLESTITEKMRLGQAH